MTFDRTQGIPPESGSCRMSSSKEHVFTIKKAIAINWTIICYVYSLGLVHHIILLMMWSRYQMTTRVYGQETIAIFDQWASPVEAH